MLPLRDPVLLAKQVATLDRLTGGRVILGVGLGAYREEFEAQWPRRAERRGDIFDEALEALRQLFTERQASYAGRHVAFEAGAVSQAAPAAVSDLRRWPQRDRGGPRGPVRAGAATGLAAVRGSAHAHGAAAAADRRGRP